MKTPRERLLDGLRTRREVGNAKTVHNLRVVGYWDGYAGRETRYVAFEYQQAWRRGAEQARLDRADGAA